MMFYRERKKSRPPERRPVLDFRTLSVMSRAVLAHKTDEHLCDKDLAAHLHHTDACAAEAVV